MVHRVEDECGIASNVGKIRVYSPAGGPPPPGVAELGTDVWRGDRPLAECGLLVLGMPVGHPEYVRAGATTRERLVFERPCVMVRK